MRVVNDALAIYFLDTALAKAFVARWCLGYRAETYDGNVRLRDDETSRIAAPYHRTE